jgi:hypothetical protein
LRKSLEYLGLSEGEVRKRIEKYGYNEVREEEKNPVMEFLSRYWGSYAVVVGARDSAVYSARALPGSDHYVHVVNSKRNDKLPAFKTRTDGFRILEKRLTTKVK